MDFEAEIDRIYSLPLGEFVAARNSIFKALRADGEGEQANEVKCLAKPNVPAWAVNQLWHRERAAFERLLEAGTAVRAAWVGKGIGGPRAAAKRSEAAKELLKRAKDLLSQAGHPNNSSTHQRISHTLDAAAALGRERLDPPLGRLTRDLEPQGFDVLAGLQLAPKAATGRTKKPSRTPKLAPSAPSAARSAPSPSPAAPDAAKNAQREKRVRAARKRLDDSLADLAAAQKARERTAETLIEARGQAAEKARAASRAEMEARDAAQHSVEAQEAETAAAAAARAADAAARKAGTEVKAARRRLDRLEKTVG